MLKSFKILKIDLILSHNERTLKLRLDVFSPQPGCMTYDLLIFFVTATALQVLAFL